MTSCFVLYFDIIIYRFSRVFLVFRTLVELGWVLCIQKFNEGNFHECSNYLSNLTSFQPFLTSIFSSFWSNKPNINENFENFPRIPGGLTASCSLVIFGIKVRTMNFIKQKKREKNEKNNGRQQFKLKNLFYFFLLFVVMCVGCIFWCSFQFISSICRPTPGTVIAPDTGEDKYSRIVFAPSLALSMVGYIKSPPIASLLSLTAISCSCVKLMYNFNT